jgi:hypothetical protein
MFAEMPLDNVTVNKCRGDRRQISICLASSGHRQRIRAQQRLKISP